MAAPKKISKLINVKTVIKDMNLDIVNKNAKLIYRDLNTPAIKSLGLELITETNNKECTQGIVCWGTAENLFFKGQGKAKSFEYLKKVFLLEPPLICLSIGMEKEIQNWVIEVATKYQIPVFVSKYRSAEIVSLIGTYLCHYYAKETQVHGCLVQIGAVGVLITGPSGSGKSEATLELIQRGHIFISDDAVIIKQIGNHFIGLAPKITKNIIEIRGIGLIDVKYTYGSKSMTDQCDIDLVIELIKEKNGEDDLDRLGNKYLKYDILDGSIDKIQVPVKDGSSVASLIEVAVSAYLARKDGKDILEEMYRRREE